MYIKHLIHSLKIKNELIKFNENENVFLCFRTNILDRYFNKDFTVTLPDHKKITDIKWFAIYDLSTQVTVNLISLKFVLFLIF